MQSSFWTVKLNWKTVIALVFVAAVFLAVIPIFLQPPRPALRSACSSNMKQLALAIQHYATDNGGKVPPLCGRASTYENPRDPLWPKAIRRYLKTPTAFFRCLLISENMLRTDDFSPGEPRTTYGVNWRFGNGGARGGDPLRPDAQFLGKTMKLDSPPQPAKTVLFIETQNKTTWAGDDKPTPSDYTADKGGSIGGNVTPFGDWSEGRGGNWFSAIRMFDYPMVPFGHGGCNVTLADGHVQFIRRPKLAAGAPTPRYSTVGRAGLTWWQLPEGGKPGSEPEGSHINW